MSACSDPSETRLDVRLVPMTVQMTRAVVWALHFVQDPEHREGLQRLTQAWDAAPADPVAVVAEWFETHFELDHFDQRHSAEIAAHVLACLGCALPRNEDHAKETP